MKRKKFNSIHLMTLSMAFAIFEVSCTSDQFFGIEENAEGLNYSVLNKIAQSKEYIEFQKQSFLNMDKLLSVDTTQMEVIDTIGDRLLYASKEKGSIRPVLDAWQKLVELYPEYEETTLEEREQILNIALLNSKSLMMQVNKNTSGVLKRTKSLNEETASVQFFLGWAELIEHNISFYQWIIYNQNGYWGVNSCDNWFICVDYSIRKTEGDGKEHGGYGWTDTSGATIDDYYASRDSMNLVWNGYGTTPYPYFDYHVHPSGNLTPSEWDNASWSSVPWGMHMIVNCNADYIVYGM